MITNDIGGASAENCRVEILGGTLDRQFNREVCWHSRYFPPRGQLACTVSSGGGRIRSRDRRRYYYRRRCLVVAVRESPTRRYNAINETHHPVSLTCVRHVACAETTAVYFIRQQLDSGNNSLYVCVGVEQHIQQSYVREKSMALYLPATGRRPFLLRLRRPPPATTPPPPVFVEGRRYHRDKRRRSAPAAPSVLIAHPSTPPPP